MMDYETEINKINNINNAIEMLDKKKAYYQLEKLNDLNFDIMFIKKIQWSKPKKFRFFMLNLEFLWELYALFYENVPKNVRKTEAVKLQLNGNTSM